MKVGSFNPEQEPTGIDSPEGQDLFS